MASSTLTLPTDILSSLPKIERRPSFVASRASTGVERPPSPTPRLHYRHDQEAIEMDTIVDGRDSKSRSTVGAPEVPAWAMSPKKEWAAIFTCCGCMFMSGWNDATTGPLLPIIQAHYNIGFIVVSMLFVSNCVGYLSAAVINIYLTDRLGFGKVILLGGVLQIVAYAMLAPAPPFPVMCISYAINGFGIGFQNAQSNGFVAELPNNTSAKLGLLHAGYGAGAFVAPLIATQFAQIPRWSFHFLTSLGISLLNSLSLFSVFKLRRQHEVMGTPGPHADNASAPRNDENVYKAVFNSRAVQLLAIFAWVYVGTEVTVGGWIVTFIVEERGGGASAGYVSSGFFGGLMLGRVALLWINKKIGERRVIYLYSVLAIGLELVIWLVPDVIGNAVAVSFVGMLLGPMIPIVMKVTSGLVPKRVLTGCIGWIASSGQVGSAVFPFLTGALAQKHGVKVLQPVLVGMIGSLIVLWTLVPSGPQRHRD
ncbi:MFS general substrate transporter [Rhizoctonia solani AG-3 Rhs1AP]|uniref:MFS general substrate transporter n=1 Tax=Rhizoctonia solani AG-3 Rhs1AP TaxID=1086054 RepID=X8JNK3_9AGAM|nr:MFS general substrate transporter [Rhizoctonia solani AG-3 Rhs1AP]